MEVRALLSESLVVVPPYYFKEAITLNLTNEIFSNLLDIRPIFANLSTRINVGNVRIYKQRYDETLLFFRFSFPF